MKVTIPGFIAYRKNNYDEQCYHFHACKMEEYGYITIQPHTLEVEIPDGFDPTAQEVAALEEEKRRVHAAYQARVTEIDRQIQNRLALTNEVAA